MESTILAGFRGPFQTHVTPQKETQLEKNMESEVEARVIHDPNM